MLGMQTVVYKDTDPTSKWQDYCGRWSKTNEPTVINIGRAFLRSKRDLIWGTDRPHHMLGSFKLQINIQKYSDDFFFFVFKLENW